MAKYRDCIKHALAHLEDECSGCERDALQAQLAEARTAFVADIAKLLYELSLVTPEGKTPYRTTYVLTRSVRQAFADLFSADNKDFDTNRFFLACGSAEERAPA